MTITREIRGGVGYMSFIFDKDTFAGLVEDVAKAGESEDTALPVRIVRDLCINFTPSRLQEEMDRRQAERPGSAKLSYEENGMDLGSDSLGYDLARRIIPPLAENEDTIFDPTYSPVHVEIRVLQESDDFHSPDPEHRLGFCVMRTLLEPPSLA